MLGFEDISGLGMFMKVMHVILPSLLTGQYFGCSKYIFMYSSPFFQVKAPEHISRLLKH